VPSGATIEPWRNPTAIAVSPSNVAATPSSAPPLPSGAAQHIHQRLAAGSVPAGPGAERRLRDTLDKFLADEPDIAGRLERASTWQIDNSVHDYLFHAADVQENFQPGAFRTAAAAIRPPDDDQAALHTQDRATTINILAVFVMLEAAERIMTASAGTHPA
jgi:hypothetical protein